jgi:hypothetical protein
VQPKARHPYGGEGAPSQTRTRISMSPGLRMAKSRRRTQHWSQLGKKVSGNSGASDNSSKGLVDPQNWLCMSLHRYASLCSGSGTSVARNHRSNPGHPVFVGGAQGEPVRPSLSCRVRDFRVGPRMDSNDDPTRRVMCVAGTPGRPGPSSNGRGGESAPGVLDGGAMRG